MIRSRGSWRHFEAFEFAILKWADWFNNRRLLKPIATSPAEVEAYYYAAAEALALAA